MHVLLYFVSFGSALTLLVVADRDDAMVAVQICSGLGPIFPSPDQSAGKACQQGQDRPEPAFIEARGQ